MNDAWHNSVLAATIDLAAALPDERIPPVRFELDCHRRILDLTSYLWKGFPLSLAWGEAVYGDALLLDAVARIKSIRTRVPDIYAAARLALLAELAEKQDPTLDDLVAYDRARSKDSTVGRELEPDELGRIERAIPDTARIVFFTHDIVAFVQALQYYIGLRAPRPILARLRPEATATALAVYSRDGRLFVLNVTSHGFGRPH
jgi:hypothetical protein